MEGFKSKYTHELAICRDPGRQLELLVAIIKNGVLYEDLDQEIKDYYNLPVNDEGIDVVVLENNKIIEVYQCKNTTKMIIGAHELGTFFNLYLHILNKYFDESFNNSYKSKNFYEMMPKKYIVGNLITKFRDTIDDVIRIDIDEELKKYFPNTIKHIREIILFEFGGDFGYLHSLSKQSLERSQYQLRVNEWFSGLAKIFKLVLDDRELINENKTDEMIKNICSKIIELKKNFETNPNFENEFSLANKDKDWLLKLRKHIIETNYLTLTLPFSNLGYLLNINSKHNSLKFDRDFEMITTFNNTDRLKIAYSNLRLYIKPNEEFEFYYDSELSKIIGNKIKHYWFINGLF